jgi:hypothetical protein
MRYAYHATFSKNVLSIAKRGIVPFQPSNWAKGSGERYGDGGIFAFEKRLDAVRWAARMEWEFFQSSGSGKVSIVRLKYRPREWEVDYSDPISHLGAFGKWLKRPGRVPPQDIVGAEVVTQDDIRKLVKAVR